MYHIKTIKQTIFRIVVSIFLILLFLPQGLFAGNNKKLDVELLIFSGRENPVFEISDPEVIKEIIRLYQGRKKHHNFNKQTVVPDVFEDTAIVISNPEEIRGLPGKFIICNMNIEEITDEISSRGMKVNKNFFLVANRKIESLIYDIAEKKGVISKETRLLIKKHLNR